MRKCFFINKKNNADESYNELYLLKEIIKCKVQNNIE